MSVPYGIAFSGWLLAAILGGYVRSTLGSGAYLVGGATLQLLAQLLRFWKPPFGLFAVSFFFVALGQAFQDTQANSFVATIKGAHRWLGLIHGCYAVGALIGPLIAATIASTFGGQWEAFYVSTHDQIHPGSLTAFQYVPTGIGVFNLAMTIYAFKNEIPSYLSLRHKEQRHAQRRSAAAMRELTATLKLKSVWLLSMFFFVHLGAGITAGGWVVEYLHVARGGDLSRVGYISSAFYGGIALGRFALAEPTYRIGEKRMLLLYALLTFALQIVFWRVPNVVVDAVMISMIGFLLGPCMVTGTLISN